MQKKILSLGILHLSLSIGKEQKQDEIHEQDSLKKSDTLTNIQKKQQ